MKEIKNDTDGEIYYVHGLEESIKWKWVYYPKQFTNSMQSLSSGCQSNLEKEEWNWRNQPAWLQALLQSYSPQDSMVLAQRQKYTSMELKRKPRDKSTHIWAPYLWQRRQEYTMEQRQSL